MPPPRGKPNAVKPNAVGCYIFAGGFTVGVLKHFNVLTHLEGNNYGVSTTRMNFPGLDIHVGESTWPRVGADFVYGNPPCAAWSGNNPKSSLKSESGGWKTDDRVNCTRAHFSLLGTVRPKVWVWESVCNAPIRGRAFVDNLIQRAAGLGYSSTEVYHDAQYLGVPQVRKRWFLVCHNVEFTPVEPDWKVTQAVDVLKQIKPEGEPAYDVKAMRDVVAPKLKGIAPGSRFRHIWGDIGGKYGKVGLKLTIPIGCGHLRVKDKGPSAATVGYAMAHPTEHRFLHVNEVAALAGFPPGYRFAGGPMGSQQLDLIARGVCPPVGEWIAKAAAIAIRKNKPVKNTITHVVYDFRKPPEAA